MVPEDKIIEKLKELILLCKTTNQTNASIVLETLLGSILTNNDDILAAEVQKIIISKIMPQIQEELTALKSDRSNLLNLN